MLVLRRVHVGAEDVGGAPEVGFEAEIRAVVIILGHFTSPQQRILQVNPVRGLSGLVASPLFASVPNQKIFAYESSCRQMG